MQQSKSSIDKEKERKHKQRRASLIKELSTVTNKALKIGAKVETLRKGYEVFIEYIGSITFFCNFLWQGLSFGIRVKETEESRKRDINMVEGREGGALIAKAGQDRVETREREQLLWSSRAPPG